MIQFNTSSPYANARGRIRKWLKAAKDKTQFIATTIAMNYVLPLSTALKPQRHRPLPEVARSKSFHPSFPCLAGRNFQS